MELTKLRAGRAGVIQLMSDNRERSLKEISAAAKRTQKETTEILDRLLSERLLTKLPSGGFKKSYQ